MKDTMPLVRFITQWEGGLSRHKSDSASSFPCPTAFGGKKGWHTNRGITYATWVSYFGSTNDDRFLQMSDEDWQFIFNNGYWNRVRGNDIPYVSIAYVLAAWGWGSGTVTAVKQLQKLLNKRGCKITIDGRIGPQTIAAVKSQNESELFAACIAWRESFFRYISDEKNGKTAKQRQQFKDNKDNLKGWLNRLQAFKEAFEP